jgi:hypothetical protein
VALRSTSRAEIAYYTVADAAFFPGLVALFNSLRLVGEDAPLFVVDCGLTTSQRDRLSAFVSLIPRERALHPVLQKATGPLAHPAEIMVLIDSDILVTRPLTPLFNDAAQGRIVAFEDDFYKERWFLEWSSLGLGDPHRQRYVNFGLLIFSATTASEFLPLFVELQEKLDPASTHFGGAAKSFQASNPFYFADQDILNAMLCTRFDGRVTRLEPRLAPVPPFTDLRVVDDDGLACRYPDGISPYALHHILKKPWLSKLDANAYSNLFTRAVTTPEAPMKLGTRDIPLRLTGSRLAPIDQWRVSVQLAGHRRFRGRLGLRPAVERAVHRVRSRVRDATGRPA